MAVTSGAMRERARIPVTGMRATIAQRILDAKTTAAQTYAFFEIDITKLLAVRNTFLANENELATRVSLISLYARATALACHHVPITNATLTNGEITVWENVNIGIAVALPGRSDCESGLLVPVVRDVQSKRLVQIDMELKDLIRRARSSELSPTETAGGTITISSTDGFLPGGWFVSTPMLNLPQVMNFQPGTPIEKPVVIDGQIAIRTILPCGVTFDHRAMDGEPVGRFVKTLRDLLTNPELMLL
jgi:pyruvate/2-oxoglutarate dehydrogenase complex dihydrolipoamide acyltransferase (E2) component